jgi:hypothetical protein
MSQILDTLIGKRFTYNQLKHKIEELLNEKIYVATEICKNLLKDEDYRFSFDSASYDGDVWFLKTRKKGYIYVTEAFVETRAML